MGGAGHDELYLFQVVQGDKGQQNGGMLHIGLIVRVGAVILVLPQLQPLAAILPLFFPKVILLWQQVRPSARKGGEENGI